MRLDSPAPATPSDRVLDHGNANRRRSGSLSINHPPVCPDLNATVRRNESLHFDMWLFARHLTLLSALGRRPNWNSPNRREAQRRFGSLVNTRRC